MLFCDAPPGSQVRTRQSRSELAKKPSKTLEKPRIPACRACGASVGAWWLHVAAGGFRRGTCKNPWENHGFLLARQCFQEAPSSPGQSWSEQVRTHQKPAKSLEKQTIPPMSYLLTSRKIIAKPLEKQAKITPRGTPQLVLTDL